MFERFTDRARRVVVLAQEEARRLDHNHIGTEHLLLGLVHEGTGVAGVALSRLGIGLGAVREQVDRSVGKGDSTPSGHIPFTPRAKKVLELSLREALDLGHNYIGTEHVLLGLVREGEGVASQVLVALGADASRVRQQVLQQLSAQPGRVGARFGARRWALARRREPRVRASEMIEWSVDRLVFRRFTVSAARVLLLADSEAMRLEHAGVGVGHLLLGLVAEGEGRAAAALAVRDVDVGRARAAVGAVYAGLPRAAGYHDDVLEAIEWALFEALAAGRAATPAPVPGHVDETPDAGARDAAGSPGVAPDEAPPPDEQPGLLDQPPEQIDTEELLLGILDQAERRDGVAAQVLAALDVSPADLRTALDETPSPGPPTSTDAPADQGRSTDPRPEEASGDEGGEAPPPPG
jgi:hypothetical protein